MYWLPIGETRHSTVCGYRISRGGRSMWESLDWTNWWPDFSTADQAAYLHVPVRKGHDSEGCVYRVRCAYTGGNYRAKPVTSVDIGMKDGRLCWMVRTDPPLSRITITLAGENRKAKVAQ